MSSAIRVPSQIPINKLYVNVANTASSIKDTNLSTVAWTNGYGQLSTAGLAVLRDMGKTVYLPAASAGASQSTVLRKIQLVAPTGTGYYGTGGAAGTEGTEFYTGYIELGGQTYGGGVGVPSGFARLN